MRAAVERAVKWPCRREPQEQEAAGKRLKAAIEAAMDDAGIRPGGFPDDDDGEQEGD